MQSELIAKNKSRPIEGAIIYLIFFEVAQSQISVRMTKQIKEKLY